MYRVLPIIFAFVTVCPATVVANPITQLLKSGSRSVLRSSTSATVRQGVKHAAKGAAQRSAAHTAKIAARSRVAQSMRHFGDDAARAGSNALPGYADDLARISTSVTAQNHRRLLMLAPELKRSGQATNVIKRLAKSKKADDAIEFLWKHRGKFAVGAAVTAVAVHADDIVESGSKHIAKPMIESTLIQVTQPVVDMLATVLVLATVGLLGFAAFRLGPLYRCLLFIAKWGIARLNLSPKSTGAAS